MLKYRIIFGTIFSALLVALIFLDSYASQAWPGGGRWTTPPGLVVAVVSALVIPFGLREMQGMLKRENVQISMRITVVASILCMLWPWLEQVSESVYPQTMIATVDGRVVAVSSGSVPLQERGSENTSVWAPMSRWFRSVKPHYLVPTVLAISLVAAFIMHSRNQRVEGAMANAGGTLLAIVYLGVLPGFYLPICMTHSAWMMLAIVGVVKSADIGAFVTGKLMGKHKLIPWLSPGKTIEGFFGGLVFSGVVGMGVVMMFHNGGGRRWEMVPLGGALVGGLLCGVILGAVGQLGDLLESLLKRDAGVKDSGVVPGLGGVLDMLDSPLLAAPVAYWMLKIVLPVSGGA